MKPNSLAFRLVAGAALWVIAALAVGGVILSSLFRDSVEQNFDARLIGLLESLVAVSEAEPGGPLRLTRPLGEPHFDQAYSGWYWQIGTVDGQLVRSRSLFDQALDTGTLADQDAVGRSIGAGPDGEVLRVVARDIVLPGFDTPMRFTVAADLSGVEREVQRFNSTLAWSLGVLGLGLIVAVLIQVRYGLQPLRRIRAALAEIRLGRADRLKGRFPAEVTPLADELNALLAHNAVVVERARTHVGNLAHALKTPLSVLANEAGTANGRLAESTARQVALMRRQVDHYLVRGRTAASGDVLGARTEVGAVLADLCRALTKIHAERPVAVETDCSAYLAFRGERQDLEEMLGNLLDNAFKWAATRVRVGADSHGGRLRLSVEDDGPGLPADERERVLQRGARLDETMPGSGLGLAIVRDIARLYGGDIALESSALGGLRAVLELPAAHGEPSPT
jgi:signal transduction histidine kinase